MSNYCDTYKISYLSTDPSDSRRDVLLLTKKNEVVVAGFIRRCLRSLKSEA